MIKKIILLIVFPFFLVLMQSSFMIHYSFGGHLTNIVLIYFILLTYFSNKNSKNIFLAAPISGFLLDFLSTQFFGFYFMIFTILGGLSRYLFYILEKKNIISFILYSGLLITVYQFYIFIFFLIKQGTFWWNFQELVCNFLSGVIIYLIYVFFKKKTKN